MNKHSQLIAWRGTRLAGRRRIGHARFARVLALVVPVLAAAILTTAAAGAARSGAVITLRPSSLGQILVDSHGRTLYLWAHDKHHKSTCYGGCAAYWPALTTHGKPRASGAARQALVSTTRRVDGRLQITYRGHPLYRFTGDTRPGQTSGEGLTDFGGRWDAVSAAGIAVRTGPIGQDGSDTMRFNGAPAAEQFTLSANGSRLRFFRDVGNVTMDTAGIERVDVNALGGADLVTVNDLSGTDVSGVNVDLADSLGGTGGDGQVDRVVVNGTPGTAAIDAGGDSGEVKLSGLAPTVAIFHHEATDRLEMNTLAGDDTVETLGLAAGAIQLFVDGVVVP